MSTNRPHPLTWAVLMLVTALWIPNAVPAGSGVMAAGMRQQQTAAAEAGVRDALQKYSTALESLDVNAVKKIQPSIPTDTLAKAFKDMRELKVSIDDVRVLSADATIARVSCRVMQTLTPRVGSRKTTSVTRVVRLRRDAELWVIDGFER